MRTCLTHHARNDLFSKSIMNWLSTLRPSYVQLLLKNKITYVCIIYVKIQLTPHLGPIIHIFSTSRKNRFYPRGLKNIKYEWNETIRYGTGRKAFGNLQELLGPVIYETVSCSMSFLFDLGWPLTFIFTLLISNSKLCKRPCWLVMYQFIYQHHF